HVYLVVEEWEVATGRDCIIAPPIDPGNGAGFWISPRVGAMLAGPFDPRTIHNAVGHSLALPNAAGFAVGGAADRGDSATRPWRSWRRLTERGPGRAGRR